CAIEPSRQTGDSAVGSRLRLYGSSRASPGSQVPYVVQVRKKASGSPVLKDFLLIRRTSFSFSSARGSGWRPVLGDTWGCTSGRVGLVVGLGDAPAVASGWYGSWDSTGEISPGEAPGGARRGRRPRGDQRTAATCRARPQPGGSTAPRSSG